MNNQPSAIDYQQHQDVLEILKADYQRFPKNQTFEIYAQNVYFKDPLNEFTGVQRYQKMIGFLSKFFSDIELELHELTRTENTIKTEWTLNMSPPLPWKPQLSIPGWSELTVNEDNLIIAHIDYWHISPWNVLRQNFFSSQKASQ